MTATTLHFPRSDEIEGQWDWDKVHAPRPLTPLAGDAVVMSMCRGFTAAQHEFGSPLALRATFVNNYMYGALVADESFVSRTSDPDEYSRALERHAFSVGERWVNEWEPALAAMLNRLRRIDFDAMSDSQLEEALDARLDEQLFQWTIHGWINLALIPAVSLTDFYCREIGPEDPNEGWHLTQGYANKSVDASKQLWQISRLVIASPTLLQIFEELEPRALLTTLEASDEGQAFLRALWRYLDDFGWRSDSIYEISAATWRELPLIPLNTIQGYLRVSEDSNPQNVLLRAQDRREALADRARARLAKEPEKVQRFEELLHAARYTLQLTEDHSYWIDQMGVAAFRRFWLSVGARLARKQVMDHRDDVFYLYLNEVRDALRAGGDQRANVARRRADFDEAAKIVPPGHLGAPTPFLPDPLFVAMVDKMFGLLPVEPSSDPDVIHGIAGSPGTAHGTARVVRSLEEASKLRPGEIMVCEMTVPPWVPLFATVSGIVADSGGVLSHCAIVAREFRLPTVVGTHVGTSLIPDGATVTVDGSKGVVRIDSRA